MSSHNTLRSSVFDAAFEIGLVDPRVRNWLNNENGAIEEENENDIVPELSPKSTFRSAPSTESHSTARSRFSDASTVFTSPTSSSSGGHSFAAVQPPQSVKSRGLFGFLSHGQPAPPRHVESPVPVPLPEDPSSIKNGKSTPKVKETTKRTKLRKGRKDEREVLVEDVDRGRSIAVVQSRPEQQFTTEYGVIKKSSQDPNKRSPGAPGLPPVLTSSSGGNAELAFLQTDPGSTGKKAGNALTRSLASLSLRARSRSKSRSRVPQELASQTKDVPPALPPLPLQYASSEHRKNSSSATGSDGSFDTVLFPSIPSTSPQLLRNVTKPSLQKFPVADNTRMMLPALPAQRPLSPIASSRPLLGLHKPPTSPAPARRTSRRRNGVKVGHGPNTSIGRASSLRRPVANSTVPPATMPGPYNHVALNGRTTPLPAQTRVSEEEWVDHNEATTSESSPPRPVFNRPPAASLVVSNDQRPKDQMLFSSHSYSRYPTHRHKRTPSKSLPSSLGPPSLPVSLPSSSVHQSPSKYDADDDLSNEGIAGAVSSLLKATPDDDIPSSPSPGPTASDGFVIPLTPNPARLTRELPATSNRAISPVKGGRAPIVNATYLTSNGFARPAPTQPTRQPPRPAPSVAIPKRPLEPISRMRSISPDPSKAPNYLPLNMRGRTSPFPSRPTHSPDSSLGARGDLVRNGSSNGSIGSRSTVTSFAASPPPSLHDGRTSYESNDHRSLYRQASLDAHSPVRRESSLSPPPRDPPPSLPAPRPPPTRPVPVTSVSRYSHLPLSSLMKPAGTFDSPPPMPEKMLKVPGESTTVRTVASSRSNSPAPPSFRGLISTSPARLSTQLPNYLSPAQPVAGRPSSPSMLAPPSPSVTSRQAPLAPPSPVDHRSQELADAVRPDSPPQDVKAPSNQLAKPSNASHHTVDDDADDANWLESGSEYDSDPSYLVDEEDDPTMGEGSRIIAAMHGLDPPQTTPDEQRTRQWGPRHGDAMARLVREVEAMGAQVIWDGKQGRRT